MLVCIGTFIFSTIAMASLHTLIEVERQIGVIDALVKMPIKSLGDIEI